MKKILLVLALGLLLFNCKSKKTVIAKRPNTTTRPVEQKPDTTPEPTTPNSPVVFANKTEQYIHDFKAIAKEEMQLYGIPASITLAQGILESGSGNGRLSVEANNHFGIKCHDWTGARIYNDDDRAQECFRKYKDAKYSFRDHSLFLKQRKRYSKLFYLKQEDYKGWAYGLRSAGYATDKKYPQKLISLIERYNLHEYDKEVLGGAYVKYETPVANERLTYTVAKGDTLYSISRRYNTTVKELQNINGLNDTTLSVGQILVVKP